MVDIDTAVEMVLAERRCVPVYQRHVYDLWDVDVIVLKGIYLEALLLVTGVGAAQRHLRRPSAAIGYAESHEPGHPSFSTGGPVGGPVKLFLGCILPHDASPARTAAGYSGHGAQNRTRGVSPAEVSRAVQRRVGRRIRGRRRERELRHLTRRANSARR